MARPTTPTGAPDGSQTFTALVDGMEQQSIYGRMLAILAELPAIGKDARNEQQKFMYRSHDAVLNALNPLLAKHGVFLVPTVLERLEARRDTRSGGVMYEVNLHVQYTFYGLAGDSFTASAWGEGTDSGDKSTNKAMTMAFKNVIAQAFAVSTADTIDSDAHTPEETVREFDPGRDLLDGAPTSIDAVRDALMAADASIDWAETLRPLIRAVFGVDTRQEIPQARQAEYGRRLANAVTRMGDTESFPSPGDDTVIDALAWAFNGVRTEIVINEKVAEAEAALEAAAAEAAAADDVDFPGEGPAA